MLLPFLAKMSVHRAHMGSPEDAKINENEASKSLFFSACRWDLFFKVFFPKALLGEGSCLVFPQGGVGGYRPNDRHARWGRPVPPIFEGFF